MVRSPLSIACIHLVDLQLSGKPHPLSEGSQREKGLEWRAPRANLHVGPGGEVFVERAGDIARFEPEPCAASGVTSSPSFRTWAQGLDSSRAEYFAQAQSISVPVSTIEWTPDLPDCRVSRLRRDQTSDADRAFVVVATEQFQHR
jgi:hypothetical protein